MSAGNPGRERGGEKNKYKYKKEEEEWKDKKKNSFTIFVTCDVIWLVKSIYNNKISFRIPRHHMNLLTIFPL